MRYQGAPKLGALSVPTGVAAKAGSRNQRCGKILVFAFLACHNVGRAASAGLLDQLATR